MRKLIISGFLFLTLSFAGRVFAQDTSPASAKAPEPAVHYYHLDFVVQELSEDGKPTNSRNYSCTVSTVRDEHDSIRVGARVPMLTGSYSSAGNGPATPDFSYQNLNVNFDASNAHEVGNKLAINLRAEISILASSLHVGGPNGPERFVTRQNTSSTLALLAIGKPTVVLTSDNIDSKGGMQVVVTATLLQ